MATVVLARYWLRRLVCHESQCAMPPCSYPNICSAQTELSHKHYQCVQDCEDALRAQSSQAGPHNVYDIYDNCPRELHVWTHARTVSFSPFVTYPFSRTYRISVYARTVSMLSMLSMFTPTPYPHGIFHIRVYVAAAAVALETELLQLVRLLLTPVAS